MNGYAWMPVDPDDAPPRIRIHNTGADPIHIFNILNTFTGEEIAIEVTIAPGEEWTWEGRKIAIS